MSKENNIMVTIITVSYNAVTSIEKTIQSVINQTYSNIEYIIIDGKSNDGTTDIIRKYADKISYWCSEPDKGIYDAMNKGIKLAHGEWVAFMNAGDSYVNSEVIKNIFSKQIPVGKLVVYGKTLVHYNWGTYIITPNRLMEIKKCMPFCHQSTFTKREVLLTNPFDVSHKITADHQLFLGLYNSNPNAFEYYSGIIADFDGITGISSTQKNFLTDKNINITTKIKQTINLLCPKKIAFYIHRIYWLFNPRYKRIS